MTREEAFERLHVAVEDARAALQPWEGDALYALVTSLEHQSQATAADRQRHGFFR